LSNCGTTSYHGTAYQALPYTIIMFAYVTSDVIGWKTNGLMSLLQKSLLHEAKPSTAIETGA